MAIGIRQKLFGVGPLGAVISFVLLTIALGLDRAVSHAAILANPKPFEIIGGVLAFIGLGLHVWSMVMLRHWWVSNELCMLGPFRWFRHPMYAAWITFIVPGAALYSNSWIILLSAALLHPIWHCLVVREERMMSEVFKNQYMAYAAQTGRFFPRVGHH